MKRMSKDKGAPTVAHRIRRWSGLMVAGLVFAGCNGDNLFTGNVAEYVPVLTGMTVPQVAFAGEVVTIRIDGSGPRGISQIALSMRGAVSKDTAIAVSPPQSRISKVVSLKIPSVLQDTVMLVQAVLIDEIGEVSNAGESTLLVFGPPAITSVSAPTIVRLGELVSVRVSAFGARKVSQIDLVARGAIQKDTSIAISPARTNVTQDIILHMPDVASDTLLTLAVNARDEVGQGSAEEVRVIPLVINPPEVTLSTPATANAGLNLDVSVHAKSVRQISEIRLELRGAVTKDVSVPVVPTQSDVIKNVSTPLPGNMLTSDLRVRAAAVDRGGVVAYSQENSVFVPLGPPVVTDIEVPLTGFNGKIVDVRVRAHGDRPLTQIEVRFRGATDSTKVYTLNPPRVDAVQDASIMIPVVPDDVILIVNATATDITGAISEIVSRTVALTVTEPPPGSDALELALPASSFDLYSVVWAEDVLRPTDRPWWSGPATRVERPRALVARASE